MDKKTVEAILAQNVKTYNAISKAFSQTRNRLWPEVFLVQEYLRPGMRVLDIGCGNGRMLDIVSQAEDVFYKGIDSSSVILSEAKNLVNESERRVFEVGDILDLKEKSESYDLVLAIAVLNHIPTKKLQRQALENIFRVLKPGGILFMTNWNLWNPKNKKSVWYSKKYSGIRHCKTFWTVDNERYPLYYYAFTKGELQRMLKKTGFTILQSQYSKNNILSIVKK